MGRPRKYFTEEERKEAKRGARKRWKEKNPDYGKQYYQDNKEKICERSKQWHQENKEEHNERSKQYRQEHKEELAELDKKYRQTPIGRAKHLLSAYKQNDKKYKRGECTLTSKWIIENIFPKPCHWCGEVGWEIMGCDRIDNALPHTPDNVNPCCESCNLKRGTMTYDEYKNALRAKETTL